MLQNGYHYSPRLVKQSGIRPIGIYSTQFVGEQIMQSQKHNLWNSDLRILVHSTITLKNWSFKNTVMLHFCPSVVLHWLTSNVTNVRIIRHVTATRRFIEVEQKRTLVRGKLHPQQATAKCTQKVGCVFVRSINYGAIQEMRGTWNLTSNIR